MALAETVFAVALYWWMAFQFEWHWFSLVGTLAAPMLLLRSEESVELGVALLRRWHKRFESRFDSWDKAMMFIGIGLVVIGYFGLMLLAALLTEFLSKADWVLLGYASLFIGPSILAVKAKRQGLLLIFSSLVMAFITLIRALMIRWVATLFYLPSGLKRLPHNWRENLLVIDLTHPPELIPRAGSVDKEFTVVGAWLGMTNAEGIEKAALAVLILAWYIPSLAYRWSLKASAWLWWPLAMALMPPFQGLDGYGRREKAAVVSRGTWAFPLVVPLTLLAWLLLSLRPETQEWLALVSPNAADLSQKLLTKLAPPPSGLRYALLWVVVLLALLLAYIRRNFLAAYEQVLASPKEYRELEQTEKEYFDARARRVEWLRLQLIVALFTLGEAVALDFFHDRNRVEVERLVWFWLLERL